MKTENRALTSWVLCPECHAKTRTQVRGDTVLENFPLFCPKCKSTFLVTVRKCKIEYLSRLDAKTQG